MFINHSNLNAQGSAGSEQRSVLLLLRCVYLIPAWEKFFIASFHLLVSLFALDQFDWKHHNSVWLLGQMYRWCLIHHFFWKSIMAFVSFEVLLESRKLGGIWGYPSAFNLPYVYPHNWILRNFVLQVGFWSLIRWILIKGNRILSTQSSNQNNN